MSGIRIFDDAVENPIAYRERALRLEYRSYDFGHCMFHGIATGGPCAGMLGRLHREFENIMPSLTFFRKSPLGQVEPHFIHTDVDMGEWSALLYLNPTPKEGDGTTFWTHIPSGAIGSMVPHERSDEGREVYNWQAREKIEARFNRLVVFPSHYFHSRAIHENWGDGDGARLVQVAFGTGVIQ